MRQKIDLIIPVYRHKNSDLSRLLTSISGQTNMSFSDLNVLIVLNPANTFQAAQFKEDLSKVLKFSEFMSVQVLNSENRGVNIARQMGLERSYSEIVFFFDDDVVLNDPHLIDNHLEHHSKNPDIFAVGGYYHNANTNRLFAQVYLQRQVRWLDEAYIDSLRTRAAYLLGGHFSIKRSILSNRKISFDQKILFGSSETDFFLTAHAQNLPMHLLKNSVEHVISDSPFRLGIKSYLQGRGKKYIETKNLFYRPIYKAILIKQSFWKNFAENIFEFLFFLGYFSYNKNYRGFAGMYLQRFKLFLSHQQQKAINYLRNGL